MNDNNLRNCLLNMLIHEYDYTEKTAEITVEDLMAIRDSDIKAAIEMWAKTRVITDIKSGEISVIDLIEKRHMKYAAALIFLDWYRENPSEALDALTYMG